MNLIAGLQILSNIFIADTSKNTFEIEIFFSALISLVISSNISKMSADEQLVEAWAFSCPSTAVSSAVVFLFLIPEIYI